MNSPAAIALLFLALCLAAPPAPALEIEPNEPTPRVVPADPSAGPSADPPTRPPPESFDAITGLPPPEPINRQPPFAIDLQAQACTFSALSLRHHGNGYRSTWLGRTPPLRLHAELRWNRSHYPNRRPQSEEEALRRMRLSGLEKEERLYVYGAYDWLHIGFQRAAAGRFELDWQSLTLGIGNGFLSVPDFFICAAEITGDEWAWRTQAGRQVDRGLRVGLRPFRFEFHSNAHPIGSGDYLSVGCAFTLQAGWGVMTTGQIYSVIDGAFRLDFDLAFLGTPNCLPRLSLECSFRDLQTYGAHVTLIRQAGAFQPSATLSLNF